MSIQHSALSIQPARLFRLKGKFRVHGLVLKTVLAANTRE